LNLEFATLRAPRDGVMSSSQVKSGALITAQQTLLTTLYSSDPMWVNFTVSEDRLLELQRKFKHPPGEEPDLAPPFHIRLPDGTDYSLAGKLNFVDAFENPSAIRVPQQAVQELQGLKSVYVVTDGDKAEPRQIVANYRLGSDW